MNKWQLIETAPKDGTLILIYCPEELYENTHTASHGQGNKWLSNGCVDGWMTFDDPSHWMPLPPPPEN